MTRINARKPVKEIEMLASFPRLGRVVGAMLLGALFLGIAPASASAAPPSPRILAPELDGGTGWLGTDDPITLKSLRGKIVVFDFWTLC